MKYVSLTDLALIVAVSIIPLPFALLSETYWLYVMVLSLIYAILACSWDLMRGYTGILNCGPAAFFGIGGYFSALSAMHLGLSPYLSLFIGSIAALIVGLAIGLPCIRIRGPYLCTVTIGFSEIARLIVLNEDYITLGPYGLPVPPFPGIPKIGIIFHLFNYYLTFVGFIVCFLFLRRITQSQVGFILKAIREEEDAVKTLGLNVTKYKLFTFAVSCFFTGLAGAFYGRYVLLLSPEILSTDNSFLIITMAIVGGTGTLTGPVIGGFVLTILNEYLRDYIYQRFVIYGAVIVVVMMFAPGGLMGLLKGEQRPTMTFPWKIRGSKKEVNNEPSNC